MPKKTSGTKKVDALPGYRQLSKEELAAIERLKVAEGIVLEVIYDLASASAQRGGYDPDPRWLEIGGANIEQGFMALVRSVAKPARVRSRS